MAIPSLPSILETPWPSSEERPAPSEAGVLFGGLTALGRVVSNSSRWPCSSGIQSRDGERSSFFTSIFGDGEGRSNCSGW